MKIETTPQVRRFNRLIEEADELTSHAFDRCEPAVLAWVLDMMGERHKAIDIGDALEDLKNGGEK